MLNEFKFDIEGITDKYQLKNALCELFNLLDASCLKIRSLSEPLFVSVSEIVDSLESEENIGFEVRLIAAKSESIERLKYSYTKYRLESAQHKKRTFRLPGVIVGGAEWVDALEELNQIKHRFYVLMCKLGILDTSRERGAFITEHFGSDISLKELYRKVPIIKDRIESVSFTWAKKVSQSKCYSRVELLRTLEEERKHYLDIGNEARSQKVLYEIDLIKRHPREATFKSHRMISPHPRANINLLEGKPRMIPVNVPILIKEFEGWEKIIGASNLKSRGTDSRESRPKLIDSFKPIIERLNLYSKKPKSYCL